jgi:hypothetical protein
MDVDPYISDDKNDQREGQADGHFEAHLIKEE